MKNKRLQAIAKFINQEDKVADIGTDHGYLAIHLYEEKKCSYVIASDINANALSVAKKNIKEHHLEKKIPCILSNGLEKIPISKIDTVVIAGMGSHTILNILKHPNVSKLKNIILQSNKDYELLRKTMKQLGYCLKKETYLEEKGHDYFVMKYQSQEQKLSSFELKYGLYKEQNKPYYQKMWHQKKEIKKHIPWYRFQKHHELKKEIKELASKLK